MNSTRPRTRAEVTTAVTVKEEIPWLIALSNTARNATGFLPRGALEWYVASGNCRTARLRGQPAGYLLGRPSLRYARWCRPITALMVDPAARRRRVATTLIGDLASTAVAAGQLALQAWTRVDLLPASHMWDALGFELTCTRTPTTADKKAIALWRLQLTDTRPDDFYNPPPVAGWKAARNTAVTPRSSTPSPSSRE